VCFLFLVLVLCVSAVLLIATLLDPGLLEPGLLAAECEEMRYVRVKLPQTAGELVDGGDFVDPVLLLCPMVDDEDSPADREAYTEAVDEATALDTGALPLPLCDDCPYGFGPSEMITLGKAVSVCFPGGMVVNNVSVVVPVVRDPSASCCLLSGFVCNGVDAFDRRDMVAAEELDAAKDVLAPALTCPV
jgi:hypothetical protein